MEYSAKTVKMNNCRDRRRLSYSTASQRPSRYSQKLNRKPNIFKAIFTDTFYRKEQWREEVKTVPKGLSLGFATMMVAMNMARCTDMLVT